MFAREIDVPELSEYQAYRRARSGGRYQEAEPEPEDMHGWLDDIAERYDPTRCPGLSDPRCCTARDAASVWAQFGCLGCGWRELEDVEWFIAEARHALDVVEAAIERGYSATEIAARGVALGRRLEALELKLTAEPEWQWGRDKRASARRGGSTKAVTAPHAARVVAVIEKMAMTPRLSGHAASIAIAKASPELGGATAIYASWKKRERS